MAGHMPALVQVGAVERFRCCTCFSRLKKFTVRHGDFVEGWRVASFAFVGEISMKAGILNECINTVEPLSKINSGNFWVLPSFSRFDVKHIVRAEYLGGSKTKHFGIACFLILADHWSGNADSLAALLYLPTHVSPLPVSSDSRLP